MIRQLTRLFISMGHRLDAMLLVSWLATLCWLLTTGNDQAFLHPRFRPFLLTAAVLLAAFAGAVLRAPRRPQSGWAAAAVRVQALMVLTPLILLYTVANQGMGTHALARKYTGTEQESLERLLKSDKDHSKASDPESEMTLLDIARRMKLMNGRRVITEGLVYRPAIMPPNYLTLFRFAIFCCAADALPVWVFVEWEGVEAFSDEDWIQVTGTVTIVNFNGMDVPVIKADSMVRRRAPSPGEQYLFF